MICEVLNFIYGGSIYNYDSRLCRDVSGKMKSPINPHAAGRRRERWRFLFAIKLIIKNWNCKIKVDSTDHCNSDVLDKKKNKRLLMRYIN